MQAPLGFGSWNSLDPVGAAFKLETCIRASPANLKYNFAVAACATLIGIYQLYSPSLVLGIMRVHTKEVGSEHARLIASCGE